MSEIRDIYRNYKIIEKEMDREEMAWKEKEESNALQKRQEKVVKKERRQNVLPHKRNCLLFFPEAASRSFVVYSIE